MYPFLSHLRADYVSYTNPPKYVCPRDHVKTCSLPCYKRHQQRASCNGKRDPTTYVKKEQLTTASGIDHDYNFLSGVERVFDKADKNREERGITEPDQNMKRRWHNEGNLQKYLRQNHILVDRAPVGMSRQKMNQTRYIQKSKRIVWTVEWVDADGVKRLSEAHEAATIGEAYAAMLADKERETKKRKRDGSVDTSSKAAKSDTQPAQEDVAEAESAQITDTKDHSAPEVDMTGVDNAAVVDATTTTEAAAHDGPSTSTEPPPTNPTAPRSEDASATQDHPDSETKDTRSLLLSRIQAEQSRQATLRAAKQPTGPPYFYLLRPHTSANSRVVIPLFAENTVTSSLSEQTVLEFPTIHVLDQGQDELKPGFMTEDAYIKAKQEEDQEVEELLKAVPGSADAARRGFGQRGDERAAGGDLDPSKILEMLKRDVPS